MHANSAALPAEIFKAYDIRGVAEQTLTSAAVLLIGRALGSQARSLGHDAIVVGRDGRLSSPKLMAALVQGMCMTGMNVIDIGQVTTPMSYFAAHHLGTGAAVMVTGSHNPQHDNGLKMLLAGQALYGEAIQALRQRIENHDFSQGEGHVRQMDITAEYFLRITRDIGMRHPMKIVVDAGNGVAGAFAPALYRALGCEVEELFCDVDGHFPNHHPDPSVPANLIPMIECLRNGDAELGLAFDGDGDRLGVVTRDGSIIFPDRLLMLFAADVLARNPGGQIIFDVKSSRHLYAWIRQHGGVPMLWKTGHSLLKARLRETDALLAGELSGHIFFRERWYGFDDAFYAGARLLEILSQYPDASAVLHALPESLCTPELHLRLAEGEAARVMVQLRERAHFADAVELIFLDGLRVEYADGFGLVRASNTTPVITLRFEGDDAEALARIQRDFREQILAVAPEAQLPF